MGVTIGATWRIRLVDMCGGDDEACCHHRPITVATCYFVPDRDAKYCALYVCMSVCLRAYLKNYLCERHQLCCLRVAVAVVRSSADDYINTAKNNSAPRAKPAIYDCHCAQIVAKSISGRQSSQMSTTVS